MERFASIDNWDKIYEYLQNPAKPDKSIYEHTADLLKGFDVLCDLGYIKDETLQKLILLAIFYHDHGKANDEFRRRLEQKNARFDDKKEVGHNILSIMMIPKERAFYKPFFNNADETLLRKYIMLICYAVLNHHHYIDNKAALNDENNNYNKVMDLSKKLLAGLPYYPLKPRARGELWKAEKDDLAVLTLGSLCRCDYAASAGRADEIEYKNDFLTKALAHLRKGWRQKNPDADWRDLQKFCQEHTKDNLIITAPTGMGKTEAGLMWIGDNKGFFVLPLRTAINAMYERVKENVGFDNADTDKRIAVLHSDTMSVYLGDKQEKAKDDAMNLLEYASRSKNFALPLNISTPDQLFDFVFKASGYEVKLSMLSYSKLVIDEIQAYDASLLAYLIYGIKRIYELGGKICILTATLPPFVRDLILEKTAPDAFVQRDFSKDEGQKIRHNLSLEEELTAEKIKAAFERHDGGKPRRILVICDTIKKAQEIYEELKQQELACEINLLHSKFVSKDRRAKEESIKNDGNPSREVPHSVIWISTSLVEASLDIDFDEIHTELSELCGLFQRLGRCNRRGLKSCAEPNSFVYMKINDRLLKDSFDDKGFIDKTMYDLSKQALVEWRGKKTDGKITEQEKQQLLETYFTRENMKESEFMNMFNRCYNFVLSIAPNSDNNNDILEKFRNIVSYTVIPEPYYEANKTEIDGLRDEINELNEKIRELYRRSAKEDNEKERQSCILKRLAKQTELMAHTVNVNPYDIIEKNKTPFIEIGSLKIYVVKAKYDSEIGFRKAEAEKNEDKGTAKNKANKKGKKKKQRDEADESGGEFL
jgi:CRISPR-associated endonuclease/helicase Cas3